MKIPLALGAGLVAATGVAQDDELRKRTEEAQKITMQLVQQIGGELRKEYEMSGPLRSVVVCKYAAPEISSALSRRNGAEVKRVSLKVRNPALGSPDAWEQKILMDFDKRAAKGEKPETIDHAEIVQEAAGRYMRYMKAIPVGPLCLQCHGSLESMSEATRAQIASEYPYDKATGYSLGQIRGAVTYKKPL